MNSRTVNKVLQINEDIEYNNQVAIRNLIVELEREMSGMRRCYRKAELKYSIIPVLRQYLRDLEILDDEWYTWSK